MELEQLKQLDAIATYGTLSAAAERLHISQSALSRSIQRLEDEFGCKLFERTKNSLSMNDVGEIALEHARLVLSDVSRLEEAIAEHARKHFTLHTGSCAPAPLWRLVPMIAQNDPDLLIVPQLKSLHDLERDLMSGNITFAILPYEPHIPGTMSLHFMDERLYAVLPPDHPLAHAEALSLEDLNGETFLMYHGVGFWLELLDTYAPDAHYVLQTDYVVFSQLSQTSPLPGFVTDASESQRFIGDRSVIPITNPDAQAHYHLVMLAQNDKRWLDLFEWISKRVALENPIA